MFLPPVFRRVLPVVVLALGAVSAAAGVVKWTDANGQVHYGDRPPDGANTATTDVKIRQPGRPVTPAYTPAPADSQNDDPLAPKPRSAADDAKAQADSAKSQADDAARREREAQEAAKRQRESDARINKAIVEHCKAARETYCNQGADVIRQKQYEHDLNAAADQQDAAMRSGRPIPESQRIHPQAPCEWPRTCTPKKK